MAKRARRKRRASAARVTRVSNHAQLQTLVAVVNERGVMIAELRRELDVQFRRLAQIQAELDVIKRARPRMKHRA
jgi:hypothetical protein